MRACLPGLYCSRRTYATRRKENGGRYFCRARKQCCGGATPRPDPGRLFRDTGLRSGQVYRGASAGSSQCGRGRRIGRRGPRPRRQRAVPAQRTPRPEPQAFRPVTWTRRAAAETDSSKDMHDIQNGGWRRTGRHWSQIFWPESFRARVQ